MSSRSIEKRKKIEKTNEEKFKELVEKAEVEKKETISVRWGTGCREYSKEIHGGDYKKLAEMFAKKMESQGGEIVK